MGLVRYKGANSVAAGLLSPRPPQSVEWVEKVGESEPKLVLNLRDAGQEDTTWTKVAGGAFTVDDEKYPKLVAALDANPAVYRAGGGQPSLTDSTRTD